MADIMSGDYEANQAALKRAFDQAVSNINLQRQSTLQRYGYDANGAVDPSNKYGQFQQMEHGFTTDTARTNQDYDQQMSGVRRAFDLGGERENSDYANTVGDLGAAFSKGKGREGEDYQRVVDALTRSKGRIEDSSGRQLTQMLTDQTRSLGAIQHDQVSRGLGSKGLGGQALHSAEGDYAATRGDFREQVRQALEDNMTQGQDAALGHNRALGDMSDDYNRSLRDAGTGHARSMEDMLYALQQGTADAGTARDRTLADLGFQHGVNEQGMGLDLADSLHGFDMQQYGAQTDYADNSNSAMLAAILASLGADTGQGTTASAITGMNGGANDNDIINTIIKRTRDQRLFDGT